MNASPMAYARRVVADILATDPGVSVVNVFNDDMFVSGKIVCYPYVSSMTYDNNTERGMPSGFATAAVEILCNATTANDASKQGLKTEAAADIVSRIKYRMETYNLASVAVADDGRFKTRIVSVAVDGNVGAFDDGSGKIMIGIAATVEMVSFIKS